MGGLLQVPVAGLQVPAVWHWSEAVHTTGFVPTQAPARQVSACVQVLASLQGPPSGLAGLLQVPVAGLQVPAAWHWSEAVHTTGSVPTQGAGRAAWGGGEAMSVVAASLKGHGGVVRGPRAGVEVAAGWDWSGRGDT